MYAIEVHLMRIAIICPAPSGSRLGNRVTAVRWRRLLRELGHDARIDTVIDARPWDMMIALHARHSAEAVRRSRERWPERPVILVLTGTDLYRDIHQNAVARATLDLADRLAVLHPLGGRSVPAPLRHKVRVVPQSAEPLSRVPRRRARTFDVAVVAHLRPEKDPLRTAMAARLLPSASRVRVIHAGRALSETMRKSALAEVRENPRYSWLGEVATARARALIASAHLLSLTSEIEGGANVLSEAIASGTPIVASRIDCAIALLGKDHPGLFPVGSTRRLAALIDRAENDTWFLAELARRSRARRPIVSRGAERTALRRLVRELQQNSR